MTTEELEMLHALSEAEGITAAEIVRAFVRREYAKKLGDKRPGAKKR